MQHRTREPDIGRPVGSFQLALKKWRMGFRIVFERASASDWNKHADLLKLRFGTHTLSPLDADIVIREISEGPSI